MFSIIRIVMRLLPSSITRRLTNASAAKIGMRSAGCTVAVVSALVGLTGCGQDAADTWESASRGVYTAEFSKDARYLAVGSIGEGPQIWDVTNIQPAQNLDLARSNLDITSIDFSPDDQYLVLSDKQVLSVWEVSTGKSFGYWQSPSLVRDVALSPGGRYVLMAIGDNSALYADVGYGNAIGAFRHEGLIESVDISSDGLIALTGGRDNRAKLWSLETGKPLFIWQHDNDVIKVSFSPSAKLALTAEGFGQAYIWDTQTGEQQTRLQTTFGSKLTVSAAEFSKNEKYLVVGTPASSVSLWEVETGKRLQNWTLKKKSFWRPSGAVAYDVAFSDDGKKVWVQVSNGLVQSFWVAPEHLTQ